MKKCSETTCYNQGQIVWLFKSTFHEKWRFPFTRVLKSRNLNVCCVRKLGVRGNKKNSWKKILSWEKSCSQHLLQNGLISFEAGQFKAKEAYPSCSVLTVFGIPTLSSTLLPYGMELSTGPTLPKAGGSQRQGQAGKPLSMMSFLRFWISSLHCRAEKSLVIQRTVHRNLSEEGSDTSPAEEPWERRYTEFYHPTSISNLSL